ncbi:MAG: sigma-54 dependent transcriptional regulator [Candidatus Binatia bacterium]
MSESRILVAEDEESIRFVLKRALEARGYHVRPFAEGLPALAALRTGGFDLAIVDIRLPDVSGLDLLSRARDEGLDVAFLVITAESTMQNAIEAMKRGAFDYLTKPFDIEEIQLLVERALGLRRLSLMVENLKEEIRPQFTPGSGLVGKAPAMQEIYKTIGRVAGSDATVLLQGESGTGKELIARALHFHSGRGGPFVAINCSAIPRDLLESELFGHERGAFTGAIERVLGKFEVADKGTLFLDEISELPLELQAKLLRVLQEHEFVRLGAREPTRTDARIVSATNRDLADLVRKGKFREDLFFRLNVVPIVVPPLRARRGDIPELVRYFIQKINREMKVQISGLTPDAEALIVEHSWPGNVRELENALIRACVMAGGRTLTAVDFPFASQVAAPPESTADGVLDDLVKRRLRELLQQHGDVPPRELHTLTLSWVERPLLEFILERTSGNQLRAAQILGINRNTLRKKITALGIAPKK